MLIVSPSGRVRYPTRAEVRHDEAELAQAILDGAHVRPEQAFGEYFIGRRASCALGAAYEGMYHLPGDATGHPPEVPRAPVRVPRVHAAQLPGGLPQAAVARRDDPAPQRRPSLVARGDRELGVAEGGERAGLTRA
jgi:hypothetical protein